MKPWLIFGDVGGTWVEQLEFKNVPYRSNNIVTTHTLTSTKPSTSTLDRTYNQSRLTTYHPEESAPLLVGANTGTVMKPTSYVIAALAVLPGALAVDTKKSAIVWFDDPSTPDSVVDQAKEDMIKAGGKITHEFSIIK